MNNKGLTGVFLFKKTKLSLILNKVSLFLKSLGKMLNEILYCGASWR